MLLNKVQFVLVLISNELQYLSQQPNYCIAHVLIRKNVSVSFPFQYTDYSLRDSSQKNEVANPIKMKFLLDNRCNYFRNKLLFSFFHVSCSILYAVSPLLTHFLHIYVLTKVISIDIGEYKVIMDAEPSVTDTTAPPSKKSLFRIFDKHLNPDGLEDGDCSEFESCHSLHTVE
jgi:hypothetical protein